MWFFQKSGFAKNPQIHFYKYKTFLQIQTRRKNGGMESIM